MEPFSNSAKTEAWFAAKGWQPADFQRQVWSAYLGGQSGLLHSSTGSGKTLAVWMGLLEAAPAGKGLKALWLTPLRALAADTLKSLQEPMAGMGLDWRIESRTGDSSSYAKQRQFKDTPDALITTPESLSLMMANAESDRLLSGLELVVVDEWHELMGTKRGVQTELGLARLKTLSPGVRIWGLSATLGNTETAAQILLNSDDFTLVQGTTEKQVIIDSLLPETIERFPWAGHIGTKMVPQVCAELDTTASALVFTNTRAQAEIWFQAILAERPEFKGFVEIHHGSLHPDVRIGVEEGLKQGILRAVVCTSSLDLGVDFSPVERVFQIGSPKGVARILQRAGRSGHQPGAPSRVTCVPTHAMELIEIAAARNAAHAGHIESREYFEKPFDVLSQHLVTRALGGGFAAGELLDEVRQTWSYRNLTDQEWTWALEFVTQGGSTLGAYPEYHKVVVRDGHYVVEDRHIAQRHRMNIGTIVSDSAMAVKFLKGHTLGSVEESFVSRLKRGDQFVFSGRILEFVMTKDMTCYVRNATKVTGVVPRWQGGRMPLSNELSQASREILEEASNGILEGPEMQLARGMLQVQARWSKIPAHDELLIEQVQTRNGFHLFIYPFEGRSVHEGLSALVAYRISQFVSTSFMLSCNDYGFELLSPVPVDLDEALSRGIFETRNLAQHVLESLNVSELARRQFREIARVAGLVSQNVPGTQKSTRQVQVSSSLLYEVFSKYDPHHPLLAQAQREVLERTLEESRLTECLKRISKSRIITTEPKRPTPFAFPIMVDRLRDTYVSSESPADQIARLLESLERAAG